VLRALNEAKGIRRCSFDYELELFSLEIDPAATSFNAVRKIVAQAAEREGRVYRAVIMSL
jgi:hypothetical protein